MTRSPNYSLMIKLDAIDPEGVDHAFLDLYAPTAQAAISQARIFLRPEVKIISATKRDR